MRTRGARCGGRNSPRGRRYSEIPPNPPSGGPSAIPPEEERRRRKVSSARPSPMSEMSFHCDFSYSLAAVDRAKRPRTSSAIPGGERRSPAPQSCTPTPGASLASSFRRNVAAADLDGAVACAPHGVGFRENSPREVQRPALARVDCIDESLDGVLDRGRQAVRERQLEMALRLLVENRRRNARWPIRAAPSSGPAG